MINKELVASTPKGPNTFKVEYKSIVNRDSLTDWVRDTIKQAAKGTAECDLVCGTTVSIKAADIGFFCVCEEQIETFLKMKVADKISKALKPLVGKTL